MVPWTAHLLEVSNFIIVRNDSSIVIVDDDQKCDTVACTDMKMGTKKYILHLQCIIWWSYDSCCFCRGTAHPCQRIWLQPCFKVTMKMEILYLFLHNFCATRIFFSLFVPYSTPDLRFWIWECYYRHIIISNIANQYHKNEMNQFLLLWYRHTRNFSSSISLFDILPIRLRQML